MSNRFTATVIPIWKNSAGKNWDAVIDTCGYLPQTVKASAEFLKDKVNQYVFISSGSVYPETPNRITTKRRARQNLMTNRKSEVEKIDSNRRIKR